MEPMNPMLEALIDAAEHAAAAELSTTAAVANDIPNPHQQQRLAAPIIAPQRVTLHRRKLPSQSNTIRGSSVSFDNVRSTGTPPFPSGASIVVVDGSADPFPALNPAPSVNGLSSNNNSDSQQVITPPSNASISISTVPSPFTIALKSKSNEQTYHFSGRKVKIPGLVVDQPLPKPNQNFHVGRLNKYWEANSLVVVYDSVYAELQKLDAALWLQSDLIRNLFKTPNGKTKRGNKQKWKNTTRVFPLNLLLECDSMYNRLIILCLWIQLDKPQKDDLWERCMRRYDRPTLQCQPKLGMSSAEDAATSTSQGTEPTAINIYDSDSNKRKYFEESDSNKQLQASNKKHRKIGDAPTTTNQVDDRTSRRSIAKLQQVLQSTMVTTNNTQVENNHGVETEFLLAIVKKTPTKTKLGNRFSVLEDKQQITVLGGSDDSISNIISMLTNVSFSDSDTSTTISDSSNPSSPPGWTNSDSNIKTTVWTAASKRPLPCDVDSRARSKKTRSQPAAIPSQVLANISNTADMEPSTIATVADSQPTVQYAHAFGSNFSASGWWMPINQNRAI